MLSWVFFLNNIIHLIRKSPAVLPGIFFIKVKMELKPSLFLPPTIYS